MKFGKLQQRFFTEKPKVYDKETKTAYLDIQEAEQTVSEGGKDSKTVRGYTAYPVELDGLMDYGHIKSRLIEAAYPPKDEFGFAMNAIEVLFGVTINGEDKSDYSDVITETNDFLEYRKLCAEAAKEIVNSIY